MQAGTTYSKKKYKFFAKLYSISGIIFSIIGILLTIAAPPIGIIILIVGIVTIAMSRYFKKSSIEGGYSEEVDSFVATNKVGDHIYFNENTKQILISPKFNPNIINYSDILSFELMEDGKPAFTSNRSSKNDVATVKSLKIKVVTNDMDRPNIYIDVLGSPTRTDSIFYRSSYEIAHRILSMLEIATSKK